jgi:acid phosphatase (class A)
MRSLVPLSLLLTAALAILPVDRLPAAERYLGDGAIDVATLLPPPVALGSAEELAELALVLRLQEQRSASDATRIHDEDVMSLATFSDAVGPWFTPARLPGLSALVLAIHRECRPFIHAGKALFAHPRPPSLDPRITPLVSEGEGSYPSGHSTRGMADALILAELVPEARQALLDRGQRIGFDRVVAGVHFPSDVVAGRVLGQAIAHALLAQPGFHAALMALQSEIAAARASASESAPAPAPAPAP